MHKTTRLVALFGALTLVVGACSGSATPAPSVAPSAAAPSAAASAAASAPASAAPSAAAALSGTLTIWDTYGSGGSAEADAMIAALALAKTTFPDLTVNRVNVPFSDIFNKTNAGWGAGDAAPDMFIAPNDSLGVQTRLGILENLDTALAGKLDGFAPITVDGSKVDGKLMMVPESAKTLVMFYNSSLVKTVPASLDDLMTMAKAGTKVGIDLADGAYYNWAFYSAFGGKILDDSGKCVADQGGVADSLKYLADLKATGNVTFYMDKPSFQADFKTGKTAIVFEGPWASGDFKSALADKLASAPIPPGPKGKSQPMTGNDGWYINANSTNKDLAVAFALWMVTGPAEQIFADKAGHLPAFSAIAVTDPIGAQFAKANLDGYPRPQNKELDTYWTNFSNAQQEVINKGTSATTAVATACSAMNKANGK
jgi:arabinogalactan oligomer / maltooligosaccharide transport system substrate-binding protein